MSLSVSPVSTPAQAARAFEGQVLGALLKPMFEAVDVAHGPLGGGDAEATWRALLTEELGRHIAAHGGIGLADSVLRQMMQTQEQPA